MIINDLDEIKDFFTLNKEEYMSRYSCSLKDYNKICEYFSESNYWTFVNIKDVYESALQLQKGILAYAERNLSKEKFKELKEIKG